MFRDNSPAQRSGFARDASDGDLSPLHAKVLNFLGSRDDQNSQRHSYLSSARMEKSTAGIGGSQDAQCKSGGGTPRGCLAGGGLDYSIGNGSDMHTLRSLWSSQDVCQVPRGELCSKGLSPLGASSDCGPMSPAEQQAFELRTLRRFDGVGSTCDGITSDAFWQRHEQISVSASSCHPTGQIISATSSSSSSWTRTREPTASEHHSAVDLDATIDASLLLDCFPSSATMSDQRCVKDVELKTLRRGQQGDSDREAVRLGAASALHSNQIDCAPSVPAERQGMPARYASEPPEFIVNGPHANCLSTESAYSRCQPNPDEMNVSTGLRHSETCIVSVSARLSSAAVESDPTVDEGRTPASIQHTAGYALTDRVVIASPLSSFQADGYQADTALCAHLRQSAWEQPCLNDEYFRQSDHHASIVAPYPSTTLDASPAIRSQASLPPQVPMRSSQVGRRSTTTAEDATLTSQRRRGGIEVVVESPNTLRQRQALRECSLERERPRKEHARAHSAPRQQLGVGASYKASPLPGSAGSACVAEVPMRSHDAQVPVLAARISPCDSYLASTTASSTPSSSSGRPPRRPSENSSRETCNAGSSVRTSSGCAAGKGIVPVPPGSNAASGISRPGSSVAQSGARGNRRAASAGPSSGARSIVTGFRVQSNRKLIRNCLERVCLKGEPNRAQREHILKAFDEELIGYERLVILFKSIHTGRHDLRALYGFKEGQWIRVFQVLPSPPILEERMVAQGMRYDSGGKEFKELPAQQEVLIVADAVFVQPQHLQKIR